jgi:hypothetical protein
MASGTTIQAAALWNPALFLFLPGLVTGSVYADGIAAGSTFPRLPLLQQIPEVDGVEERRVIDQVAHR